MGSSSLPILVSGNRKRERFPRHDGHHRGRYFSTSVFLPGSRGLSYTPTRTHRPTRVPSCKETLPGPVFLGDLHPSSTNSFSHKEDVGPSSTSGKSLPVVINLWVSRSMSCKSRIVNTYICILT